METTALWAHRPATSLNHCFAASDLEILAWAHGEFQERIEALRPEDRSWGLRDHGALQPLVFYLAANQSEAAHQIGAISRFMDALELLI